MRLTRSAGILLHPTSLPGPDGIGDLGAQALRFVDFLAAAGQTLWQVLPLGPPGAGDSPYASPSAFAGNPMLISLARLRDEGLLDKAKDEPSAGRVDHGAAARTKARGLRRAYQAVESHAGWRGAFDRFVETEAGWLDDFALYATVKDLEGGASWTDWPGELAAREPAALDVVRLEHRDEMRFHQFVQYAFDRQWRELRAYAADRGVRVMGDVPIFVAHDSADVWAHRELFQLDAAGRPAMVAGVPPDYFSPTGQLWGNPLYRWETIAERGYAWWIERFRRVFQQVDVVRVDHFRGFAAYWSVPAAARTAVGGSWQRGPGAALFEAIARVLGPLPIVAEDLGTITPDVLALRERLGAPGMKVLQFAFGDTPANPYLPHNYESNAVVYTGTHDNDTTLGWFTKLSSLERHGVRSYLATDGSEVAWDLIRLALGSVADTAIVPLQDVLGLGSSARMNTPGVTLGNWSWRYDPRQLGTDLADRLGELAKRYNRVPLPKAALEDDKAIPAGYPR